MRINTQVSQSTTINIKEYCEQVQAHAWSMRNVLASCTLSRLRLSYMDLKMTREVLGTFF